MRTSWSRRIIAMVVCLGTMASYSFAQTIQLKAQDGTIIPLQSFIAHAGGIYQKYTYSNSKEALDNAYDLGYRFIEMDFYKTNERDTEGQFVMLHSNAVASWYFGNLAKDGISYDEFLTGNQISYLTLLTVSDLDEWLTEHQDVFIIGDKLKTNEYKRLCEIYPHLKGALIPQVNSMAMYNELRQAGFKNLIWTVYSTSYASNPKSIVALSKKINVVGITMPYEIVPKLSNQDIKSIQKYNRIFVHTVNKQADIDRLRKKGITGFYTDHLELSKE